MPLDDEKAFAPRLRTVPRLPFATPFNRDWWLEKWYEHWNIPFMKEYDLQNPSGIFLLPPAFFRREVGPIPDLFYIPRPDVPSIPPKDVGIGAYYSEFYKFPMLIRLFAPLLEEELARGNVSSAGLISRILENLYG